MDQTVEVVEPRGVGGLGLFLRVRPSGRLFRVAPTRDPRQPRFWCLVVFRCTPSGVPHPGELPWVGGWGTPREDLATTFAGIRADVDAWLGQERCLELRHWLFSPDPAPASPVGAREKAAPRATTVDRLALHGAGDAD